MTNIGGADDIKMTTAWTQIKQSIGLTPTTNVRSSMRARRWKSPIDNGIRKRLRFGAVQDALSCCLKKSSFCLLFEAILSAERVALHGSIRLAIWTLLFGVRVLFA